MAFSLHPSFFKALIRSASESEADKLFAFENSAQHLEALRGNGGSSVIPGSRIPFCNDQQLVDILVLAARGDFVVCCVELHVFSRATSTWTTRFEIKESTYTRLILFGERCLLAFNAFDPHYSVIQSTDRDFSQILDVEEPVLPGDWGIEEKNHKPIFAFVHHEDSATLYGLTKADASGHRQLRSWIFEPSGEISRFQILTTIAWDVLRAGFVGGYITEKSLFFLSTETVLKVDRNSLAFFVSPLLDKEALMDLARPKSYSREGQHFIAGCRDSNISIGRFDTDELKIVEWTEREILDDARKPTTAEGIAWSRERGSIIATVSGFYESFSRRRSRQLAQHMLEVPLLRSIALDAVSKLLPATLRRRATANYCNSASKLLEIIFS